MFGVDGHLVIGFDFEDHNAALDIATLHVVAGGHRVWTAAALLEQVVGGRRHRLRILHHRNGRHTAWSMERADKAPLLMLADCFDGMDEEKHPNGIWSQLNSVKKPRRRLRGFRKSKSSSVRVSISLISGRHKR